MKGHPTTIRHYGLTKEPLILQPTLISVEIEYQEGIGVEVLAFVLATEVGDHHQGLAARGADRESERICLNPPIKGVCEESTNADP